MPSAWQGAVCDSLALRRYALAMIRMTPVILCGGGGTRLWPRSRMHRPKPFLDLAGEGTLIQATLKRCDDGDLFAAPVIVTGASHAGLVETAAGHASGVQVIVEPEPKNTAAAIALAALRLPADAVMLVCPSDHHIEDAAAFRAAAQAAGALADKGWLVAMGVEPDRPETGFGYILNGEQIEGGHRIAAFVEKPDRQRAEAFLADGGYSWNTGIFAFTAGHYLSELARHRPVLFEAVHLAVAGGTEDGPRFFPEPEAFGGIEAESVDYAVMEQTDRAAIVRVAMGWSDIGNWFAIHQARRRDVHGNSVSGEAELVDCRNVLVDSDGPRVSAIGLEDVVIVVDGHDILVCKAGEVQRVGKLSGAGSQ